MRDRARADGAPAAALAGRAVDGARADRGRADFDIIREINAQGTPILLVEQNALMALDAAHRGYVLETGKIALEGPAKDLRGNERVRKTYLGEE